jgi:hypothetical protein
MTKISGSGSESGSGSISQRHGSADPDPPQNVMDPQHWFLIKGLGSCLTDIVNSYKSGYHPKNEPDLEHGTLAKSRIDSVGTSPNILTAVFYYRPGELPASVHQGHGVAEVHV